MRPTRHWCGGAHACMHACTSWASPSPLGCPSQQLLGAACHIARTAGKTLAARAVASRTDAAFIRVIGSELVQRYVGEGARLARG